MLLETICNCIFRSQWQNESKWRGNRFETSNTNQNKKFKLLRFIG